MSKGRILFINRVFPPDSGASGLRLLELAHGLAGRGWRVSVLTNQGRGAAPADLHPNVEVIRLKQGGLERPKFWHYPFWLLAFFLRAARLPRHDIVVTLSDPPMLQMVSAALKKLRRMHAVHWVHDLYPDLYPVMGYRLPLLQPYLMLLSRMSLRAHDRIVALGGDMVKVLHKSKVRADRVAVTPHWPDVKSALLDKRKPRRADSDNPFILENSFTVLYSGNFGLIQDFDAYIDAIKIIQQTSHPIRFIFAGDGLRFNAVRARVEDMMLTNTHFVRAQPKNKFIDMLLAGDLHVATMIPESVGMVAPSKINSALGLARPCLLIGSPEAFQAKLITDYQAGRVVDPNDPHAKFDIAETIIEYATNDIAFEQAKMNALRAAESIAFDKGLDRFDALFSELVA